VSNIKTGTNSGIKYMLPMEEYFMIKYSDEVITVYIYVTSDQYGTFNGIKYLYETQLKAKNKEIIDKLLFEISNKKSSYISHYNVKKSRWTDTTKIEYRNEDTLILDEVIKKDLFDDLNEFITSKEDYKNYGIPYKRNYLFHGPPGTGKSSLINIMAKISNRSIYIIPYSSDINDSIFCEALNSIDDENAILLIEDIDCMFSENSNISLSSMLNILDGVSSVKSLITVITTNHIDKLGTVITRPGRIDKIIEFKILSKDQIVTMLEKFNILLEENTFIKLLNKCTKNELTPAVLMSFLFKHRNKNKLNNANFHQLFDKYLDEFGVALKKDGFKSFYT
jgi:ATP-dependent 26S proteasome regulatory subunit